MLSRFTSKRTRHYALNWCNCLIVCPFRAKSGKYYSRKRGKLMKLGKCNGSNCVGILSDQGKAATALNLSEYTMKYVQSALTYLQPWAYKKVEKCDLERAKTWKNRIYKRVRPFPRHLLQEVPPKVVHKLHEKFCSGKKVLPPERKVFLAFKSLPRKRREVLPWWTSFASRKKVLQWLKCIAQIIKNVAPNNKVLWKELKVLPWIKTFCRDTCGSP